MVALMISRNELGNILRAYIDRSNETREVGQRQVESERNKSVRSDRLALSSEAKEIQRFRDLIKQLPDVRTDRVETIKESLAAGTYNVDPTAVAQQMIGSAFSDRLV